MSLLTKNIIVILLILVFSGIFTFHWFFVDNGMPVVECFSLDCVYSAPRAMPQQPRNVFTIFLIIISYLFIAISALLMFPDNRAGNRQKVFKFFEKFVDIFCYKLRSWLKILEKRDPSAAFDYGGF